MGFLWTGADPEIEQITKVRANIILGGETLATPKIGVGGRSVVGSSTARSGWSAASLSTSADYTILCFVTCAAVSPAGGNPFDGDTVGPYRWFQLSPVNDAFIAFATSGANYSAPFPPSSFSVNKSTVLAGRCQGGVATAWQGGQSGTPVTVVGGARGGGNANAKLCVGAFANGSSNSQPFLGNIYLCAYWSRALSDAEIKSMSTDPWQIFNPQVT
jgi:hypothetical protein